MAKIKINIPIVVNCKKVDSSQIEAIGWLPVKVLVIKFNNGKVYSYHPVSNDEYQMLIGSESIGKYFSSKIKNNPDITCTKQE